MGGQCQTCPLSNLTKCLSSFRSNLQVHDLRNFPGLKRKINSASISNFPLHGLTPSDNNSVSVTRSGIQKKENKNPFAQFIRIKGKQVRRNKKTLIPHPHPGTLFFSSWRCGVWLCPSNFSAVVVASFKSCAT